MPRQDDRFSPEDRDALSTFLQRRRGARDEPPDDSPRDEDDGADLTRWPLMMLLDAAQDTALDALDKNKAGDTQEVEFLLVCCLNFTEEIQRRFFPADDGDDGDDDEQPGGPDAGPTLAVGGPASG